jgi:RsiW-degrading membrane proteinase PrsW (M82 family)
MPWELALPITAAASGVGWARLAARRAGERRADVVLRALLGGIAAFGLGLTAYDLAALAGVEIAYERLAGGGAGALAVALAIGLVEEGAKLAGLLLVVERGLRRSAILASAAGVAAGFAALEAILVLHGDGSATALARAALAPVAHALLAVPLALGVAAAASRTSRRWVPLVPALLASAALHGAGDLSLALRPLGPTGYGLALAAPALFVFARARRARGAAAAPHAGAGAPA